MDTPVVKQPRAIAEKASAVVLVGLRTSVEEIAPPLMFVISMPLAPSSWMPLALAVMLPLLLISPPSVPFR
jgi:hypothetical protein